MVLRHLRSFTGKVLLFAFAATYDDGVESSCGALFKPVAENDAGDPLQGLAAFQSQGGAP